ncbi:enhancer of split mgamma protein-like [Venturia canescens]|uniref:enhancer of split mgamma protein-like n=1 Tax=Venturia canescens TaxID=32260 RepID=UPI001C9C156A|nr:enhancer of split mgamma protein-like [Venturia canescens]
MMSYDYPHPVSRTYQYKKITKPLLERKRRARINRCLDELKDLMVDALETEGENISKLEKADILELTVRHLQRLHASRPSGLSSSESPSEDGGSAENRWQSGFGHCAAEACRYLAALPGESGERLARHLASGLRTTRQRNVPVTPKNLAPSLTLERERKDIFAESRTPNLPVDISISTDSRGPDSPNDSSRYSVISDSSEPPDAPNNSTVSGRVHDHQNPDVESPLAANVHSVLRDQTDDRSLVITKITDNKILRLDPRPTGGDDDEEIDVEGVDEGDPMWRPW